MNEMIKPTAAISGQKPPFDPQALLTYCYGSEALARKLLESFQEAGPQYLQEMLDALDQGDCPGIRAVCHKIRGGGSIIQAEALLGVVAELRQHAIDENLDLARDCTEALRKVFADLLSGIRGCKFTSGGQS